MVGLSPPSSFFTSRHVAVASALGLMVKRVPSNRTEIWCLTVGPSSSARRVLARLAAHSVAVAIKPVDIDSNYSNGTLHVSGTISRPTGAINVTGDWNAGLVVRIAGGSFRPSRNCTTPNVFGPLLLAGKSGNRNSNLLLLALVSRNWTGRLS